MRECFTRSGSSDINQAAPRAHVLVDTGELERLRGIEQAARLWIIPFRKKLELEARQNPLLSEFLVNVKTDLRSFSLALAAALDGQGKGREGES